MDFIKSIFQQLNYNLILQQISFQQLNYISEESFGHMNDVIIEADLTGIDVLLGQPVRETWRTETDAAFDYLFSLDSGE